MNGILEAKRLLRASRRVALHDGFRVFLLKAFSYTNHRARAWVRKNVNHSKCLDVLFVNGCSLPHPSRYRVAHQMEQLQFNGLSCEEVWYELINDEMVLRYGTFIFYRCPSTPAVASLLRKRELSTKKYFFDI